MPINLQRKMEAFDNQAKQREIVYAFVGMMKKRAAMHAGQAEERGRARTAEPPSTQGKVSNIVTQIEKAGMKSVREMSPKLRRAKIPDGAFMSRQRTETGVVKRYRAP